MERGDDESLDFFARKGGESLLRVLSKGAGRWKDIELQAGVSPRTLSQRISEALEIGLIVRKKQLRGGARYKLTEKGKDALNILPEKIREGDILEPQEHEPREDQVLIFFPRCPLCHQSNSKLRIAREGRKDAMLCLSCGAKWHLKIKGDQSLKEAKLVEQGADGQGANLINETHKPDFWLRQALKGHTTWPENTVP